MFITKVTFFKYPNTDSSGTQVLRQMNCFTFFFFFTLKQCLRLRIASNMSMDNNTVSDKGCSGIYCRYKNEICKK